MTRTLQAGSVEYVWAEITDTTGQDLTAVTVEMAVAPYRTPPTTWQAPDEDDRPSGPVIRAAVLVTAAVGDWSVYARLTDTPETPVLEAGYFSVR